MCVRGSRESAAARIEGRGAWEIVREGGWERLAGSAAPGESGMGSSGASAAGASENRLRVASAFVRRRV